MILFFLLIIVTLTMVAAGQIATFHQEVAHGLSSTRASYAAEAGVAIDKRRVEFPTPIKAVGDHQATVALHPEVKATIKLQVVSG